MITCVIEKADAAFSIGTLSLVKCKHCGLIYVNPQPDYSPQEFSRLYSQDYFKASYMKFYLQEEGEQSNEPFDFRLDWIEKNKAKGRILDIGCASGGFLVAVRERGWEAFGVEVSKVACDMARDKHDLNVFLGDLFAAKFDDDFFDVVMVGDLLEHIEEPKVFLKEVNRVLKKEGLLYLAVPDFDGLYYKCALLLSALNHKNYFVLPHHIYFFNKSSISKYLNETNFELVDVRKSESNPAKGGLTGMIMQGLFFIARLIRMQDRILFLAKKV